MPLGALADFKIAHLRFLNIGDFRSEFQIVIEIPAHYHPQKFKTMV